MDSLLLTAYPLVVYRVSITVKFQFHNPIYIASKSNFTELLHFFYLQGKGLFAQISLKEGEVIFEEHPVVSTQFLWNEMYKYLACEYCLQSLETAEEMSRRLTENPALDLPYQECCEARPSEHVVCPDCQVSIRSTSVLSVSLINNTDNAVKHDLLSMLYVQIVR